MEHSLTRNPVIAPECCSDNLNFGCSGTTLPCFPEVVDSVTPRLSIQAAVAAKCALQEDLCRFLGFGEPLWLRIDAF